MSDSVESYACPTCSKSYKRREHLQRHALTHLSTRFYRCDICDATFTRSDVLRRHNQTCSRKSRGTTTSRRRRACDRCAHQKKACNLGQPCGNCQLKATSCEYSYVTEVNHGFEPMPFAEPAADISFPVDPLAHPTCSTINRIMVDYGVEDISAEQDFESLPRGTFPPSQPAQARNDTLDWLNLPGASSIDLLSEIYPSDTPHNRAHFPFLYNFTSRTGLSSFDCGSLTQRQHVLASALEERFHYQPQVTKVNIEGDAASGIPSKRVRLLDPLVTKIEDLVDRLQEVIISKPRNSVISLSWTPAIEQQCRDFFSPVNIRHLLALYWAIWHPNVNFIHKPSFNAAKAKSCLIAAMTLIGACVSSSSSHREQAEIWFDCVEEMVFNDEDFCYDLPVSEGSKSMKDLQKSKVQALQAAYIVCLYQNWEGSDVSRRRIRRYRFSTLVSVLRDTNAETVNDENFIEQLGDNAGWYGFASREELIRTFLWIFLLDTCFVIFNNLPPRMVINELQMRMSYPESCFQADSAEECAAAIREWTSQSSNTSEISLRKAIQIFCSDVLTPGLRCDLASLGPLNLFVIISGIHILIFQRMNSFGDDGNMSAIHNALRNWQDVWELYTIGFSTRPPHAMVQGEDLTLAPHHMWKRVGFARHSYDYWLLAKLIVDRMSSQLTYGCGLDVDIVDEKVIVDPVLHEYDQNNMRQVNELIASFENTRIG